MVQKEVVSDEKLIEYIDALSNSFGIRKNISKEELNVIREPFQNKEFSKCILEIKLFLKLLLTLRIGYRKNRNPFSPNFLTSPFFDCGMEPAQVAIPADLPLYGTNAFDQAKVTMYLERHFLLESFETFTTGIVHEMAHIVLYSTRHQLKSSEIATDLMVMLLGFSEVMKIGRKMCLGTLGYLTDSQFQLAYHEIRKRNGSVWQKTISHIWFLRKRYLC